MKRRTKAIIEGELKLALADVKRITKERDDALESKKDTEQTWLNDLKRIEQMLNDELRIDSMTYGIAVEQAPSLSRIAFKIGRMSWFKEEYLDLKDRTLPVPKMQVLREDRDDRRNGGRGSGVNLMG